MSAFISAGQRCTCARRLIVQDTPAGPGLHRPSGGGGGQAAGRSLERRAAALHGPRSSRQPSPRAWCRRRPMMEAKGGKVLLQMRQLDPNAGFVTAGIVDVTDAQGIPDEEWFGPLLQVVRVKDFDQRHQRRERHRIRPGRRAAVAVGRAVEALRDQGARRRRQLEPSDHGRRQLGAVRRRRQIGQPPPERLLRGRLLRLPGRLDRNVRTGNAGQAVAGTHLLTICATLANSTSTAWWARRTTTPASRSATSPRSTM
jgi:hypothetical protein